MEPALLSAENIDKKTPLHFAGEYGHEEIIATLMKSAASQTAHAEAYDMFHTAIESGHDKVVSQLLDHHPELIDVVDGEDGMSPLHLAAKCGRHSIVADLFARRQPRYGGKYDMTLLHFAAQYGYDTIVAELLVEQPHLIDVAAGKDQETVLHVAAKNGRVKIVYQLLAQKPDLIDAKDSLGMTPLFSAIRDEQDEVVEELLAYKPKLIDSQTECGYTPLGWACSCGHLSTVALLLTHNPAVIDAEIAWGAMRFGKDDSVTCDILGLLYACEPELMVGEVWGGVLLHEVFREKDKNQLYSEKVMKCVWQLSPPHALHKPSRYMEDTPFHVAINNNNTFAIELVQGKLSFEEITAAYAKCNKECVPFTSLLDKLNAECLLVSLWHKDVVGTVWEYLVTNPNKRKRDWEEN